MAILYTWFKHLPYDVFNIIMYSKYLLNEEILVWKKIKYVNRLSVHVVSVSHNFTMSNDSHVIQFNIIKSCPAGKSIIMTVLYYVYSH